MITQQRFVETLQAEGVDFFTGVPDSYLNGFCNYLLEQIPADRHVIAANEGNAAAIAAGHYIATGGIPLVYMQNSGMGNALNPLVSLADSQVYGLPMLLLIGWRGEPGTSDHESHAQHRVQGEITTGLLELLQIPYVIAEDDDEKLEQQTRWALRTAKERRQSVAVVAKKGIFAAEKKENATDDSYPMSREEAIEIILDALPEDTIYAATTGRATRELYFLRDKRKEGHKHDFLNLGSMGHVSSVALGIAMAQPDRRVVCLDGDAAALMHLGAFTMASKAMCPNLLHILLNNGAHESVGGQPSAGWLVDFTKIAEASGYRTVGQAVTDCVGLADAVRELTGRQDERAAFLEVRIHKGLRGKLPPLKIDSRGLVEALAEELQG
ncbi:MAG: phosphonopyruvate decarboxylase [bacterium]|nr:phosphonopyruvate decarboxylase [bacterium]